MFCITVSLWLFMTVAGLGLVARYGSNVPSWDEWDIVPTMTGVQPITLEWLWSQHNEHRIPVPRLVMLALFRIFGDDFRIGMYLNVLLMAALALGLIYVARRIRGRTALVDIYFPLILLNFSHSVNFLWGWQVEFAVSTALAGGVLLIIAASGRRPTMAALVGVWLLLLLLVGCGAHGVALVPAIACWLGYCGVVRMRSGEPNARRDGSLIVAMGLSAIAMAALYFVGFNRVPYHPSKRNPLRILPASIKFLTAGFGTAVRPLWPLSGHFAVGLLLMGLATLAIVARVRPAERYRATGLLAFLGAMGSLALGLGMGRDAFEPRYIILSVPALCCIFLSFVAFDPLKISKYGTIAMFLSSVLLLWSNTGWGIDYADDLRGHLGEFERDMMAGVPTHRLIHDYKRWLHLHEDLLSDYMPLLRRAGVGSFKLLQDDPLFREIPVPLVPVATSQLKWKDGTAVASGSWPYSSSWPYMVFQLPQEVNASGIRIRFRHSNSRGITPYLALEWKSEDQEDFREDFRKDQSMEYWSTGDRALWVQNSWLRLSDPDVTLTTWVCGKVRQIRIHPDVLPCVFELKELVVLVPDPARRVGR